MNKLQTIIIIMWASGAAFILLLKMTFGAIPTPSVYCADNYTLVSTTQKIIFNGTAEQLQNVTSVLPCAVGELCSNNTLWGAACDPPVLQQPLYLAGFGLLGIIVLGTIIFILRKVL